MSDAVEAKRWRTMIEDGTGNVTTTRVATLVAIIVWVICTLTVLIFDRSKLEFTLGLGFLPVLLLKGYDRNQEKQETVQPVPGAIITNAQNVNTDTVTLNSNSTGGA